MSDIKYRRSCDLCLNAKIKCSQTVPSCSHCLRKGKACVYSQYRKIGRPSKGSPLTNSSPPRHRPEHNVRATSTSSVELSKAPKATLDDTLLWQWSDTPSSHESTSPWNPIGPPNVYADISTYYFDGAKTGICLPAYHSNVWPDGLQEYSSSISRSHEHWAPESNPNWHSNSYLVTSEPQICSAPLAETFLGDDFLGRPQLDKVQHQQLASNAMNMTTRETYIVPTANRGIADSPSVEQSKSSNNRQSNALSVSQGTVLEADTRAPPLTNDNTWCSRNCYSSLTKQLTYLSKLIDYDCSVSLETYFNLNQPLIREREMVLCCASCMRKSGSRHSLDLAIRVFEKTLALLEMQCHTNHQFLGGSFSLDRAQQSYKHSVETSSGSERDASTNEESAYNMLRMHLETQTETMLQLNRCLATDKSAANYREDHGILLSTCKRLEDLKGIVYMAHVD